MRARIVTENVMIARCLLFVGLVSFPRAGGRGQATDARKRTADREGDHRPDGGESAKGRLEKRGEIYLDSEDFKDVKNFAIVITKEGAASLKETGIADPADHFKGKKIRPNGTVKEVDGVPRIEVDEAKKIRVVESMERAGKHRAVDALLPSLFPRLCGRGGQGCSRRGLVSYPLPVGERVAKS